MTAYATMEATMRVGLMAPQGWKGEYDGWDPAEAWQRTIELAGQAEELGRASCRERVYGTV